MVAVAIAAFDFGAIRAMFGSWGHSLLLGALPMANVLAVGILVGQQRPGSRPFLLGFEVFGAMALAFYIVAYAWFFPESHELVDSYLAPWLELMEKAIGRNPPFAFVPIVWFGTVLMLGWPQVAFALIGGSLSRRARP
jgi:hypothetical protein